MRHPILIGFCLSAALVVSACQKSGDADVKRAEIEGNEMFISAEVHVTAQGRPRIASG